jgi:hypothetical protein
MESLRAPDTLLRKALLPMATGEAEPEGREAGAEALHNGHPVSGGKVSLGARKLGCPAELAAPVGLGAAGVASNGGVPEGWREDEGPRLRQAWLRS